MNAPTTRPSSLPSDDWPKPMPRLNPERNTYAALIDAWPTVQLTAVTVVVVTRNPDLEMRQKLLEPLAAAHLSVLVMDNASTGATSLEELDPSDITLFSSSENPGIPGPLTTLLPALQAPQRR